MAYTTIDKPTDYFNTKLYTGNGSTGHSITGVGFTQDWTWIKERSQTENHFLFDTVRGDNKYVNSNTTDQEYTESGGMAFNSDGFTLGSWVSVNENNQTYASWNWKAGGTAVSNTDGSITSSVSANQTAGFSIVSYTGNATANSTVGHGLGVAPSCIIVKKRNGSFNWGVYHKSTTAHKQTTFTTNLPDDDPSYWNDVEPTSSVFNLGSGALTNGSGSTMIAYCFSDVKGYSKFSSYVGNGSSDGSYIHLGFKASFVMFKNITTASTNWHIVDNKRDTFNIVDKLLLPNESGAEITQSALDLTSNGFKIRVTNGFVNNSGDTYIYMAFAENPFTTSTGVPTTAR